MNFFELLGFLGSNIWLYGIIFILILSVLVFVHEWGHYIIARLCGVKVEVFSIGFGKELAGFNDKNGTRWKFALVPLGGYVKLFGDVDPASTKHAEDIKDGERRRPMTNDERSVAFFAKPVWQRAAIVVAGPAINYIFAILIFTLLFTFNGQPVTPPMAGAVVGGSSADKYGFEPHDMIISIDGKPMLNFEDIRREMMISLDTERHFVIERDGQTLEIMAVPERVDLQDRFGFNHSRGMLGLISPRNAIDIKTIRKVGSKVYTPDDDLDALRADLVRRLGTTFSIEVARGEESDVLTVSPLAEYNPALSGPVAAAEDSEKGGSIINDNTLLFIADSKANTFLKYPPHIAFIRSVRESWVVTRSTLEALGQMVVGTRSAKELGGVIRIGALAGDMAKQGLIAVVLFTALLSINLGLINLFPIPMLDGGHLVFYAVEAVLGRPIPEQIQEYAFRAGLVFLVGLMVFANLNDIMQLLL